MMKPQLIQSIDVGVPVHESTLSWSPDGNYLLVGGDKQAEAPVDGGRTGEFGVWGAKAGVAVRHISQRGSLGAVSWSPNNQVVGAGTVQLLADGRIGSLIQWWDVTSSRLLRRQEMSGMVVKTLAFSPDQNLLLVAGRMVGTQPDAFANIHLVNNRSDATVRTLSHGEQVWSVGVSPNGQWLASSAGRVDGEDWKNCTVRLWDIKSGKQQYEWQRPNAKAQSTLAFSPDGSLLVTGDGEEGDVILLSTRDGSLRTIHNTHKGVVYGVSFSKAGDTLATGGKDGWVRLWAIPSGTLISELKEHKTAVHSVAFSPKGDLLAAGDIRHIVNVWQLQR